ncbi:ABC transporter substrate-binding protein [Solidesulfovibrio sp.]|uniref:ABC transporter substrate-binding protein n=1 Tax=Solidesulfovibrio sp. TaxID=2910990 RepID=UPI002B1F2814|nr:ABC transporter substrate-binding protein [Solidesulfovibrio sp.]MEA4855290.1 ABC transporter substrate-binding protein [Solidesulfovibrio sp.]
MRKRFGLLLAALAVFVLAFGGLAAAEEKVYVNGIDFGFPPFGFVDKDGKPTGFDVESLDWIANKMGFKVKHQPMDWDGIIPALLAKKIDIIASGMSATAERAQKVDFSIPYYEVTQVLVVPDKETASLDALLKSGKKLGIQRGTVTAKLLEELATKPGYKFEVVPYDSTDLSMEDVKIGRIAGSGMDSTIAQEVLKAPGMKVAGTFDAAPEKYGYAMRKEDKDFQDKVNKGLKLLMAAPYWKELKAKYGL